MVIILVLGWYTEKYRRDEGELDTELRKTYLRNAQDSQSRMPQMTAAIKGQSMELDGRMDKLVWGGKAQLKDNSNNSNNSSNLAMVDNNDGGDGDGGATQKTRKKRKKRKQKKERSEEKQKREDLEKHQQRKLVLQSSVAGVAVGAVAVAAVSAFLGGGSSGKK